jgi:hypothetical protein
MVSWLSNRQAIFFPRLGLLSPFYCLGRSGCLPTLAFWNAMGAGLKLNRSGIA